MYIFVTGFEFKLREVSRRVIMGLVVDHELDFTEIRVRQLASVVDLFVILESNITTGKTEPCWWTQVRVQVLNNWLYNFVLSLIFCWILFMLWELLLPRLCFHGHVLPMFRTSRVTIFYWSTPNFALFTNQSDIPFSSRSLMVTRFEG